MTKFRATAYVLHYPVSAQTPAAGSDWLCLVSERQHRSDFKLKQRLLIKFPPHRDEINSYESSCMENVLFFYPPAPGHLKWAADRRICTLFLKCLGAPLVFCVCECMFLKSSVSNKCKFILFHDYKIKVYTLCTQLMLNYVKCQTGNYYLFTNLSTPSPDGVKFCFYTGTSVSHHHSLSFF